MNKLKLTLIALLIGLLSLSAQDSHNSNIYFKNGTDCVTYKVTAYSVGPCGNVVSSLDITLEPKEVVEFMFQVDYGIMFKFSLLEQYCPEKEVEVHNYPEGRSQSGEFTIYKGGDYLRGRTIVLLGGVKA